MVLAVEVLIMGNAAYAPHPTAAKMIIATNPSAANVFERPFLLPTIMQNF